MQETRKQSLKQQIEIALDEEEAPNGVFDSKDFWVSEESPWWVQTLREEIHDEFNFSTFRSAC